MPDINEAAVWAIYLSPVASFVVIAAFLRQRPLQAGRLTIAAVGLSWLLGLWALSTSLGADGEAMNFHSHLWAHIFNFEVAFGVNLDGLSSMMVVVVTSVSLLVQVYSTGYMHGDTGYARYYAYMSLFTAAMLGLVLASSLLQLFIHWELVGVSSYLLIGFWFHRPSAAAAAKKAFIVTRFGDFGFMVAVILVWTKTGDFDIAALNHLAEAGDISRAVLTGVTLGMLMGAVGKSAQFPLHIWLPDAMEGPTPVSALIHAATMVVAGVYLISRFFPMFHAAPDGVLTTVAYIGGFTAILAASIGMVSTDIKRVLAYSTISQLAYMFVGLGTLGLGAAIFHLMNHAFFKALLFLGSGSVIHGTGTQDMRRMGGLRTKMRVTYLTFLAGSLSLAGIPAISGWWSKDEILTTAARFAPGGEWSGPFGLLHMPYEVLGTTVLALGLVTAGITGFYTFRMVFMTFWGKPRYDEEKVHVHESPAPMRNVLVVLSVFALFSGLFVVAASVIEPNTFEHHVVDELLEHEVTVIPAPSDYQAYLANPVLWASTFVALSGVLLAYMTYARGIISAEAVAGLPRPGMGSAALAGNRAARGLHAFFTAKWGMDWLFLKVAAAGDAGLAAFLDFIDRRVVDGATYGMGRGAFAGSMLLQRAADGIVRNYATWVVGGLVLLLVTLKFVVAPVLGGG